MRVGAWRPRGCPRSRRSRSSWRSAGRSSPPRTRKEGQKAFAEKRRPSTGGDDARGRAPGSLIGISVGRSPVEVRRAIGSAAATPLRLASELRRITSAVVGLPLSDGDLRRGRRRSWPGGRPPGASGRSGPGARGPAGSRPRQPQDFFPTSPMIGCRPIRWPRRWWSRRCDGETARIGLVRLPVRGTARPASTAG